MSEYLEPSITSLKIMWMNRAFADPDEAKVASDNFDILIDNMLEFQGGKEGLDSQPPEHVGKSHSQMFLEIMMELDQAVLMIPSRIAAYRKLLASFGLDSSVDKEDGEGKQGMPGINVADQGSLGYHDLLLRLASGFASSLVEESNSAPEKADFTD